MSSGQPFFTIGVPTLNRHDLLRETLHSILAQDFTDFEVIVGNDYTQEILSGAMLGISDPRIRFVNHPRNLREVGNMNALLEAATGRYFTWLFDDDLFDPGFLKAAHDILAKENFPPVVFPGYRELREGTPAVQLKVTPGEPVRLTGRGFLRAYFSRRLDVISTTGFFETVNFINTVGGVEELCDSVVGLYCEYLLLVKCALLEQIVYIDAPYVVFRVHADSWGASNTELHKYLQGGERLVRKCAEVMRHPELRQDLEKNLIGVSKIHLAKLCFVTLRAEAASSPLSPLAIGRALKLIFREIKKIKKTVIAESGGSFRLHLNFSLITAKCIYLVLFSFVYYGLKRKSGKQVNADDNC